MISPLLLMLRLQPRAAPANIAAPKHPLVPKLLPLSWAGSQANWGGKGIPASHNTRGLDCQGSPMPWARQGQSRNSS